MGRTRYQEGSLRLESRKGGKVWRLRFRITRADGKRVEHAIVIGTKKELPNRAAAREFVKSLYLPINHPGSNHSGRPLTFGDIAAHYLQEELADDQSQASIPKAHSTTETYRRYLQKWVLPRWGEQTALLIQPLDLENWLKELGRTSGLENQTRSKIRQVIGLVYKHAQRVGFLPRTEQANPIRFVRQSSASNFDPIILTPAQAFAIIDQLGLMLRTLVLVTAATALRISEILALQWKDIDVENQCIYVRRAWVYGKFGKPKSKASKRPVPLHAVLAAHLLNWRRETPYSKGEDLVFPSFKLRGRKPPRANMLLSDHLRPAARKVGVVAPPRAFGFHTFRRTLASVLVANNYDPKLVQELLRHSNIKTTLDIYAQAITSAKLEAQGMFLGELLKVPWTEKKPSTTLVV
ncbi:MAG TPA: site-specific integrase [Terriglobales bacterium]|nr:site-specific integrase [Terriglobales bacterium]